MTDHSTARALELAANIMASMRRAKFPSEYAAEAHDEFEATVLVPMLIEALTPPEGDTVSEGTVEQLIVAVHALIVATDGMEALRPQRQAALDAMERAAIAAIQSRASPQTPIPMLLYCPQCGQQHIDEPDERTPDWTNPPHRSHLCHDCGCIWRPADVPTNGVGAIQTQGKADTWAPERGNAERALVAGDALREAREALHDGAESLSEALELIEDLDECPVPLKWANALDKMNEALVEADLVLRAVGEGYAVRKRIAVLPPKLDTAEKGDGE